MAFWGLVLEPKKTYTQREVEQPFHISMATLDLSSCDNSEDAVSVICRKQDADFILCNLSKKRSIYNVPLNLDFELGGEISFHVSGNGTVHLTGYIIEDAMESFEDEESDDSLEEEDAQESNAFLKPATKKLLEGGKRKPEESPDKKAKKVKVQLEEDEDDEDDSDFDMDSSSEEGVEEEEEEDDDEEDDDDDDEEEGDAAEVLKQIAEMKEKSKQQKQSTPNKQAAKATPKAEQNQKLSKKEKKEQAKNQAAANKSNGMQPTNGISKRTLQGGVVAEDIVVGTGPVAKQGNSVSVYYVGRLKNNNKQFDSAQSGQGFKFRLGRGEVIKGWDVGVQGMKVGGKRRLTIPAKMAYGEKGAGGVIPPHATLLFDVELKHVK